MPSSGTGSKTICTVQPAGWWLGSITLTLTHTYTPLSFTALDFSVGFAALTTTAISPQTTRDDTHYVYDCNTIYLFPPRPRQALPPQTRESVTLYSAVCGREGWGWGRGVHSGRASVASLERDRNMLIALPVKNEKTFSEGSSTEYCSRE